MFRSLAALWIWWLDELAQTFAWLNPFANRRKKRYLVARQSAEDIDITETDGGVEKSIATIGLGNQRQNQGIPAAGRFRRQPMALLLPGSQVLHHRLTLPPAARENLRQAIGYQIDEFTPFKSDDVFYGYNVEQDDGKELIVDVSVVAKNQVAPVLELLADLGFRVGFVGERAPETPGAANLLPSLQNPPGRSAARITVLLLLATLAMFAISFNLTRNRQLAELANLEVKIKQARTHALAASKLRNEIADLKSLYGSMTAAKKSSMPVMDILRELTDRLPDNSHLLTLRYNRPNLQITGFAQQAADLVSALQSSRYFKDVRFAAPVTLDRRSTQENFRIVAKVVEAGE